MRGRLNRTMSVTEPNSVHTNGLSNTLPNSKNISKQGTYNTTKDNISGNVRMFQHDNLNLQETYYHHNISSTSATVVGEGTLHNNNKSGKIGGTTEEIGTMTTGGTSNDSSKLGSIAMSSSTLPMSLSSIQQNVRTLPLPKLGLSSPWFNAGKAKNTFLLRVDFEIGKPFVSELVKDKRKYLMPFFGRRSDAKTKNK